MSNRLAAALLAAGLPARGLFRLEFRQHRADRSDLRQRRSAAPSPGRRRASCRCSADSPACCRSRSIFTSAARPTAPRTCPLARRIDAAFRGDQCARRLLDDGGHHGALLRADRPGDDLAANVSVISRSTIDNATKATVGVLGALQPTERITRSASRRRSTPAARRSRSVPLRPLDAFDRRDQHRLPDPGHEWRRGHQRQCRDARCAST